MPDPITPEQRLAEIRDLRVDSCSADAPYNPDVWALENARGDLLAEVDRLNAQIVTHDRLNRVAIGDWEREVGRLKEVAHNQARMLSEITSACMAAETERDRLKARVEELSALLIDPDRLTERARELRAIHARDEMDREMDRLADGGDL